MYRCNGWTYPSLASSNSYQQQECIPIIAEIAVLARFFAVLCKPKQFHEHHREQTHDEQEYCSDPDDLGQGNPNYYQTLSVSYSSKIHTLIYLTV